MQTNDDNYLCRTFKELVCDKLSPFSSNIVGHGLQYFHSLLVHIHRIVLQSAEKAVWPTLTTYYDQHSYPPKPGKKTMIWKGTGLPFSVLRGQIGTLYKLQAMDYHKTDTLFFSSYQLRELCPCLQSRCHLSSFESHVTCRHNPAQSPTFAEGLRQNKTQNSQTIVRI